MTRPQFDRDAVPMWQAAQLRMGWSTSATETGGLRLVRTSDISTGVVNWDSVPFCKDLPHDPTALLLQDDDVLIARSGVGSVGNVAYVADPRPAIFGSYLVRARPDPAWSGKYLYYYLTSPEGREALSSRAKGATLPNLSISRLSTIPMPVKPLQAQQIVASTLDASRQRIDKVLERIRAVDQHLETLRDSSFESAWSDTRRLYPNDSTVANKRLTDVTSNYSRFRRPLNASERGEATGDVPYYGASGPIDYVSGNTHDGTFVLLSEDGNNLLSRRTPIARAVKGKFWAGNQEGYRKPFSVSLLTGVSVPQ